MIWIEDGKGIQLVFTEQEHGIILVNLSEWASLFSETEIENMKVINLENSNKPQLQMMLARCKEKGIKAKNIKSERFN